MIILYRGKSVENKFNSINYLNKNGSYYEREDKMTEKWKVTSTYE
jgi:hypothetical protein